MIALPVTSSAAVKGGARPTVPVAVMRPPCSGLAAMSTRACPVASVTVPPIDLSEMPGPGGSACALNGDVARDGFKRGSALDSQVEAAVPSIRLGSMKTLASPMGAEPVAVSPSCSPGEMVPCDAGVGAAGAGRVGLHAPMARGIERARAAEGGGAGKSGAIRAMSDRRASSVAVPPLRLAPISPVTVKFESGRRDHARGG